MLTAVASLIVVSQLRPWDFAGDLGLTRHGVPGASLVDLFPDSRHALVLGTVAFLAAVVALGVGWYSRQAAGVCVVLGFWLLGVPQGITGTVHVHHLLVMYALLAAGPSDATWGVRPGRPSRQDAAVAMMLARAAVGLVYFFPGLAKLKVATEWPGMLEEHLRVAQTFYAPVDLMPPGWLIGMMAAGALVFELSFLVLVFTRWRIPAVLVAIGFHLTTGLLMGIWFQGLLPLLLAFLLPMENLNVAPPRRFLTAGALVIGMAVMGGLGQNRAWPVASYPKFDHHPAGIELAEAVATTTDGARYRAGRVLLPNHDPGFWAKVEHNHEPADLERAIEARLGEPVTVTWEQAVYAAS